jgi:hypothetical protein
MYDIFCHSFVLGSPKSLLHDGPQHVYGVFISIYFIEKISSWVEQYMVPCFKNRPDESGLIIAHVRLRHDTKRIIIYIAVEGAKPS